jgi:hypothetical protein
MYDHTIYLVFMEGPWAGIKVFREDTPATNDLLVIFDGDDITTATPIAKSKQLLSSSSPLLLLRFPHNTDDEQMRTNVLELTVCCSQSMILFHASALHRFTVFSSAYSHYM